MPFLQSFSSFFAGNSSSAPSNQYTNRRSIMNSTLDAFSLPTTNQQYGSGYGDALDSASSSPGPSRRGSEAYGIYPTKKDALQVFHLILTSTALPNSYPPLTHTFHRLRKALSNSFPELLETLNSHADLTLLSTFEAELGCPLPKAVRESLAVVDGQDMEAIGNISGSGGLFYGLYFLPLEEMMREWAFWRQAELEPSSTSRAVLATMASIPPRYIKQLYTSRGWIPLLSDRAGNYVGVDLDPGQDGAWGQVIVFGRDFDRKCVLWRGEGEGGWGRWLATFVEELESGEGWEADKSVASDEEEEVGYSSYNGGATYGEVGCGLRLAGDYRGWNVLEAWWDISVRNWETLGLGLDIQAVEQGLEEARRLTGLESPFESGASRKGKEKASEDLNLNKGIGESPAKESQGSSSLPTHPETPVPKDSDVLLPPSSPVQSSIPKVRHPVPSPVRIITPVADTMDHPLKEGPPSAVRSDPGPDSVSGYLSPPSSSRRRRKPPPPAPNPIDLPTRADIQAMSAIAVAETSGLRGGWVMNVDSNPSSRLSKLSIATTTARRSVDEMVDIDLEAGKQERIGSPRMSQLNIN
nr:glucan synthesis regulatory protein [Cryptococcus depauperatus CBS 7855]